MKQILILKEPLGAIHSCSDIFDKIKKIKIDYDQENLILFSLNTKNQINDARVIFKGGLNGCVIDPKTIFRQALLNNACNIIIAHNHPSGDLKPSTEDKKIYELLTIIGENLQLNLLDSVIFNKNEYYSMRE